MTPGRREVSTGRRGIALLLVVGLLVVCGVTLIILSRRSLLAYQQTADELFELKHRWTVQSIESASLEFWPELLRRFDRQTKTNDPTAFLLPGRLQLSLHLNDWDCPMIWRDESSVINVNQVISVLGNQKARQCAQSQVSAKSLPALIWGDESESTKKKPKVLRLWDDLFDVSQIETVSTTTQRLTLWSKGPVNVHRASDETITSLSQLVVTSQRSQDWLSKWKEREAGQALMDIWKAEGYKIEDIRLLQRLFDEESSNASVWLIDPVTHQETLFITRLGSKSSFDVQVYR